jgi:hypothetical protein
VSSISPSHRRRAGDTRPKPRHQRSARAALARTFTAAALRRLYTRPDAQAGHGARGTAGKEGSQR